MVCELLRPLEEALIEAGGEETFRGEAWLRNCREWVYYKCVLNRRALRQRVGFPTCVVDHEHVGTHDAQEAGFVCEIGQDAIMGSPPECPAGQEFA